MPPSAAFLSLAQPMRCGPLSFRSTLKWMPCEMTSAMGVCAAVFSILQLHNPRNFNARNWNSAEEQLRVNQPMKFFADDNTAICFTDGALSILARDRVCTTERQRTK